MSRVPWSQRRSHGLPLAREAAIAVEAVLQHHIHNEVDLDRMLVTVELSLTNALRRIQAGRPESNGFDPTAGTPSRSRLAYTQRARTADEIKQQMALESRGRAAVATSGSVTPQSSDAIADPAALVERVPYTPMPPPRPRPQPQPQPRAQQQRASSADMPWL